ncbi:UNVERIFIED_CONTAM: hypothetical protein FKN15_055953 [Acipenser sinensis]
MVNTAHTSHKETTIPREPSEADYCQLSTDVGFKSLLDPKSREGEKEKPVEPTSAITKDNEIQKTVEVRDESGTSAGRERDERETRAGRARDERGTRAGRARDESVMNAGREQGERGRARDESGANVGRERGESGASEGRERGERGTRVGRARGESGTSEGRERDKSRMVHVAQVCYNTDENE